MPHIKRQVSSDLTRNIAYTFKTASLWRQYSFEFLDPSAHLGILNHLKAIYLCPGKPSKFIDHLPIPMPTGCVKRGYGTEVRSVLVEAQLVTNNKGSYKITKSGEDLLKLYKMI